MKKNNKTQGIQDNDMPNDVRRFKTSYREKRDARGKICHCCRGKFTFCWRCRCGFTMCQGCLDENAWGMTCNGITWQCPDCGKQNGLGNQ